MASDTAVAANTSPSADAFEFLPEVTQVITADEDKFDCPQPWYLALLAMAMSAMTTMTVAGSLFFVLAAPEKVSPHCHELEWKSSRYTCTFSAACFWTYPVVCCLFVVLVFAKNLVDQRVYYEFLLHKVIIGFDRANPFAYKVVIVLLLYAICAFSALIWLHTSDHPDDGLNCLYSSAAYISPIVSFLAVILAQWSIQGKLITLPNFLEDYRWGVEHLRESHSYHVDSVHVGYNCVEKALDKCNISTLTTPHMIALVEHYTKVAGSVTETATHEEHEVVYWQWRLLFNPRLQDDRAQSFRNWALGYFISVILAILLAIYVYICCLVTCLEIEKLLAPGTETWGWTHSFSLRPDLDHDEAGYKSLKQVAARAAVNVINGARVLRNGVSGLSHFQLGAAA
jgi:hypothetical protein|mmetsp:Transcript_49904/g.78969  ORF Transcript_49904/g.78969 Transcript_49904/m.78969 type:complete len:398 (+) Transcript_49904:31-1224(+)